MLLPARRSTCVNPDAELPAPGVDFLRFALGPACDDVSVARFCLAGAFIFA